MKNKKVLFLSIICGLVMPLATVNAMESKKVETQETTPQEINEGKVIITQEEYNDLITAVSDANEKSRELGKKILENEDKKYQKNLEEIKKGYENKITLLIEKNKTLENKNTKYLEENDKLLKYKEKLESTNVDLQRKIKKLSDEKEKLQEKINAIENKQFVEVGVNTEEKNEVDKNILKELKYLSQTELSNMYEELMEKIRKIILEVREAFFDGYLKIDIPGIYNIAKKNLKSDYDIIHCNAEYVLTNISVVQQYEELYRKYLRLGREKLEIQEELLQDSSKKLNENKYFVFAYKNLKKGCQILSSLSGKFDKINKLVEYAKAIDLAAEKQMKYR